MISSRSSAKLNFFDGKPCIYFIFLPEPSALAPPLLAALFLSQSSSSTTKSTLQATMQDLIYLMSLILNLTQPTNLLVETTPRADILRLLPVHRAVGFCLPVLVVFLT